MYRNILFSFFSALLFDTIKHKFTSRDQLYANKSRLAMTLILINFSVLMRQSFLRSGIRDLKLFVLLFRFSIRFTH